MTDKKTVKTMEFQAEVRQLLDIVIHSLYTDREIFVRELVSNASDALEKFQHQSLVNEEFRSSDIPLEIRIKCDKESRTFSICDTGIGMTMEELIENLGTIAHSGTASFLAKLKESGGDVRLIGQFGVGFYSAFMVGEHVSVSSKSAVKGSKGASWESDGSGTYQVSHLADLSRGTTVTVKLKNDHEEFADSEKIKSLIKKYSNFVPFPIFVNDERINIVEPLWTKNKSDVRDDSYTEFYRFIANAHDEPRFVFHFTADAPLDIKSILFVPGSNMEKFGFGRQDPGVNLYCRKVMIEQHSRDILPEWLRFAKGVIDSEDLPLNISRESMQDRSLMNRIKKAVVGRFLKFLEDEAQKSADKYGEFFREFGVFLKEGCANDMEHRKDLAGLLRFESSSTEPGKLTSLKEYITRAGEDSKEIYFISGPSRQSIESGPYLEAFKDKGTEVLFSFEVIDDFVLTQLGDYDGRKIVSAEAADMSLEPDPGTERLSDGEADLLCRWIQEHLKDRVSEVRVSKRLRDNPAIIVSREAGSTSSMHRVMQSMNKDFNFLSGLYVLEINTSHPLIRDLAGLRTENIDLAGLLADQILDNAQIVAGLLVEPRAMVERMWHIMRAAAGRDRGTA
ncbi:MAG: molecular chaperone HtpG [Candidatus Wallbacteria bacterium]|nr:molecular chaperone HtpG [Candidatus Wallbacteria bacterium]